MDWKREPGPASLRCLALQWQREPDGQPLYDRLWGSGFLPTNHQGIKFRSGVDPVLFLSNPAGIDASDRRRMLDDLAKLNEMQLAEQGDPEISTRIINTNWPIACKPVFPTDGHFAGIE